MADRTLPYLQGHYLPICCFSVEFLWLPKSFVLWKYPLSQEPSVSFQDLLIYAFFWRRAQWFDSLTSFYCLCQETWLDDSWKLISKTNQDSTISFTWENSKIFNISSKYFSIFNNKAPASWDVHITRAFPYMLFMFGSSRYSENSFRQFVIFNPLGYCFEETIGFDVKNSFTRRPVSHLIKPSDIIKEF